MALKDIVKELLAMVGAGSTRQNRPAAATRTSPKGDPAIEPASTEEFRQS